jgi:hypothetical protein
MRGYRPDTRHINQGLAGASYSDFRRLKRVRLADDGRFTIWGPSPSPEREALLEESDTSAAQGDAAAEAASNRLKVPLRNKDVEALDREELSLFMCVSTCLWVSVGLR